MAARVLKGYKKQETEDSAPRRALGELLSGKVTETTGRGKKKRKRTKAVELLPDQLRSVADVFAAGKIVDHEIKIKIALSEQQIKEYCLKRFCENFAATGHRPASIVYAGSKSRFTFIQTRKIYLTPEKADALRLMGVPIDDYTELAGVDIDYTAIKEHHLEFKLQTALEKLGVSDEILNEIFRPQVTAKDAFFDSLNVAVEKSLKKNENLAEKMFEVMQVLGPVNQIKNPEVQGMTPASCFKLVEEAEIPVPEEFQEDKDAAG